MEPAPPRPDLRLLLLGATAWVAGLVVRMRPGEDLAVMLGTAGVVTAWAAWRWPAARGTLIGSGLVAAAVVCSGGLRAEQVGHNPVAELAGQRAFVGVTGTVTGDPRALPGRYGDQTLLRLRVETITGRGTTFALGTPILVLADPGWMSLPLGAGIRAEGRLAPAAGHDLAGLLSARGPPAVVSPPDLWWRGAAAVRQALRDSVAARPPEQRTLVPALVDGDDAGLDDALAEDFRTTGLTHLLAVSGTNLTLVVGFLLVVARWSGVRGRWLYLVGSVGIVGFVLLARTEPSVLRAAVMGSVALLGMGSNGWGRGVRALGAALVLLLLVEPDLAVSAGFALSVLATAGILVLAPGWRDALGRWLPRWLAEAIAVPAAAQLACTPVVAAISGQVSLVAVAANLVVAPVVGPATVLGLLGGLVGLVCDPVARLLGTGAAWCVAWIVWVARHGADLPTAAVAWGSGVLPIVALTAGCLLMALVAPWLLARRSTGLACALLMVACVVIRLPTPGWPPSGWSFAMCDVGQGDGLVLRSAPDSAVVVDAGPDPAAMDRCLDRLGIRQVPLVVLTHFHADHVDGLPGVVEGRTVGAIEVTRLQDPPDGVALVGRVAASVGIEPQIVEFGAVQHVGSVTLQTIWPPADSPTIGPGDGSTANEASVVMVAQVDGIRLLLTGDVEPEGQGAIAAMLPGLHVDVLKIPHHGSRYQDLAFLESLQAGVAVVSVGADNDYGHPAAEVLDALSSTGAEVFRTDRDGSIVIGRQGDRLVTTVGGL